MAHIIESVTLNFTDLTGSKTGCVTLGSNKFWKGWVEDLGNGMGNFECRWGATGEKGNDKGSARGISLSEASNTLRKKAAEKQKKGYTLLETRSDQEELAKATAKGVVAAPVIASTTKYHPEVGRLLGIIYGETSRVVRAGLSAQAGATVDNPIGNLSDRQLDLGGGILDEIADFLKRELGAESVTDKNMVVPLVKGEPHPGILDLTNKYFSNVPREIGREQRKRENLPALVLASYSRLEAQREFLQLLRDAHLSKDIFQAAGQVQTVSGKESIWFDGLQCDLDVYEPGSADFKKVSDIFNTAQSKKNSNWWRGNQPTVRVARVFKFTRNGSEARFNAYANTILGKPGVVGKIMAFHGTHTANVLGIGKAGLLMPENLPRGVMLTGKAFGRGLYHSPAWPATGHKIIGGYPTDGTNGAFKSLNYTSLSGAFYGSRNTSRSAFLFLQDVILGVPDVRVAACWDQHRPTGWPDKDFIFACGSKSQSGFVHDEIVTFDQDAQIFRYLIEVESC